MLHLLFKKTSFLFQNDLSHCSASSIVFFSASAVTGVMRYLVLKSNGLRHSKNPPVKFSFSLKIVPATIAKKLPSQRCSQPFLIAFSTSRTNGPHSLSQMKAYTLGFRRKIAHSGSHAETGAFRTGVVSLPSDCFTRFGNPAWPGGRTANFAAFGAWPWVLPKNAESLRDSDALMRVAVPRRRGPAGLRDLFCFCRNCGFMPCA